MCCSDSQTYSFSGKDPIFYVVMQAYTQICPYLSSSMTSASWFRPVVEQKKKEWFFSEQRKDKWCPLNNKKTSYSKLEKIWYVMQSSPDNVKQQELLVAKEKHAVIMN